MKSVLFTKTAAPEWLLAFWREIDDKTWGSGFDCFTENAIANLGVSDWHGREAIRENLRAFVDKGSPLLANWEEPMLMPPPPARESMPRIGEMPGSVALLTAETRFR
jgi:hypothetical protein